MEEIIKLSAQELRKKIVAKEISAQEAVKAYLGRIAQLNPKLFAFVNVLEKEALARAGGIDQRIAEGQEVGALAGVPVAIKDNLCIKGVGATCSSKILENFISPYNATVIEKLEQADAVFIGKTNLDEFAMGSSTENSAFGITRNPWNLDCIPGGSSGGSASAVCAELSPVSLGSDTGGSIRQPAGCCGVVGLKPTYGRVSRYGLIAFASSLDQIGCFSRDIEDCALVFQAIAGYDRRDSTSVPHEALNYLQELKKGFSGLRIGLPKEYFIAGLAPEVKKAVEEAIVVYEKLGVKIEEVSLPHTEYAVAVYYIIASSEASANLARYDGVKYGYRTKNAEDLRSSYYRSRSEGFGPEVKRRIMLGTYALSSGYYEAYYGKAQKVRRLIAQDFDQALKKVDLLLTPTAPTPAFKIGEKTDDPLQMYLSDIFTIPCNLAGLPGISIPCGFSLTGLPIGLQLLGRAFEEETILRAAWQYQQQTDWHKKRPKI
ncbi:MAG: Asp-tRNA(Asn)/Glu-tRNA(Gln) amidotransferase subunit GatA [Elusimicrobiota bacterium]